MRHDGGFRRCGAPVWAGLLTIMLATVPARASDPVPVADAPPALQCVSGREVEAVVSMMVPPLIDRLAENCAAFLPPASPLLTQKTALREKFAALSGEDEAAFRSAFGKIVGKSLSPDMLAVMPIDALASMTTAMLGEKLKLKPQACRVVDDLLTTIRPLPARNAVHLVATVLQVALQDEKRAKEPPICPL